MFMSECVEDHSESVKSRNSFRQVEIQVYAGVLEEGRSYRHRLVPFLLNVDRGVRTVRSPRRSLSAIDHRT